MSNEPDLLRGEIIVLVVVVMTVLFCLLLS